MYPARWCSADGLAWHINAGVGAACYRKSFEQGFTGMCLSYVYFVGAFSASMLLVGWQEGNPILGRLLDK